MCIYREMGNSHMFLAACNMEQGKSLTKEVSRTKPHKDIYIHQIYSFFFFFFFFLIDHISNMNVLEGKLVAY